MTPLDDNTASVCILHFAAPRDCPLPEVLYAGNNTNPSSASGGARANDHCNKGFLIQRLGLHASQHHGRRRL